MNLELIIVLCFFPVLWICQNIVHEYSHLYFAKKFGAINLKLIPWPTKQNGHWHFAYSSWTNTRKLGFYHYSFIYKAPLIAIGLQFSFFGILNSITIYLGLSQPYVFLYLIFPIIDLLTWWYGYFWGSKQTDGQRAKPGE